MDLVPRGESLAAYWRVVVRRRWVIYLSVITVTLTALVGSFLITPLYRATATLQIERTNPDILTFQNLGRMDYAFPAYADFYQTQYRIISSSEVARIAAQQMGLMSHPAFNSEERKPGILARLKSLIPRRGTRVEADPLDAVATRLLSTLEVSPVRNSHLVNVSWVSPEPELAAEIANAISSAYIQFSIASQFSTSDEAEGFLVNQIGALKREIAEIEDQLQQYGEAKGIVSIDDANNITLQALKDVAGKRTSVQTTLAEAEARYRAVEASPAEALPDVLNSSLIARLREEYASYEAEYTLKSSQFKEDWPGMQTLQKKLDQARTRLDLEIEQIAKQVRASARTDYEEALRRYGNLDQLVHEQEDAAQRLKRDAVEFTNLQTEVEKKRETLNALLRRQNEMALTTRLQDLDVTSTNIRVMEKARTPAAPFRPNMRFNLMLGLLLGLLLGSVTALLLEYLDNTVSSSAELEKLVALPVLAVIPRYLGDQPAPRRVGRRRAPLAMPLVDLAADKDPKASVAEAYRELRTSILLSNPGQPPRRIVVTSSLPEEGKTATATNLAIVLAQLGKRVLLVDTDLRRPRLHKTFPVENRSGVSTFLSGLESDPLRLVMPTGVENLDLLPSGPIPPNPSELLNSTTFIEMGDQLLEGRYDHIVFDSPPVLSVSDPVIIAHTASTAILVIRAGSTTKQSIRLAVSKFHRTEATQMGVVLNDLDADAHGAPYYRYHYDSRQEPAETDERDHGNRALS